MSTCPGSGRWSPRFGAEVEYVTTVEERPGGVTVEARGITYTGGVLACTRCNATVPCPADAWGGTHPMPEHEPVEARP